MASPLESSELSESALIQVRKEKAARLKEAGMDPYPASSVCASGRISSREIREKFDSIKTGEESETKVSLFGRMITRRDMGKASFAHLQDSDGRLQIYARRDVLGDENYERFCKDFDLGDIIAAEGKIFRTKTGELSLKSERIEMLCKAIRPLPEKWHGLKDREIRARQRELDLISNQGSKEVFLMRSRIVQTLRTSLAGAGYVEVETPILCAVPGGAIAKPFETYHNALSQKLYMRVAPELYLKKCLVGGFDKIFEIGRVFRNEGVDSLHNPEFTILEAYESYGNMQTMMNLTEMLISDCSIVTGTDLGMPPYKRRTVLDLFREHAGSAEAELVSNQDWKGLAAKCGESDCSQGLHKVFDHVFSEQIAPRLQEPTFVMEFPADFSPLAKCKPGSKTIAERFELYIKGEEIANAYSELNDPIQQKSRLEEYRSSRAGEEGEGMGIDESFILALEYGMPPAGGLGIGVDRLVMLLTGQDSVKDVLLFPTLKSLNAL